MHGWPGLFAKPGLPGPDSIPGTHEDHPLPVSLSRQGRGNELFPPSTGGNEREGEMKHCFCMRILTEALTADVLIPTKTKRPSPAFKC